MVCVAEQAVVESASLVIWPGLDSTLRDDGGGGMVGLASAG